MNRYIAIIALNQLDQKENAIAQLERLGMKPTTSQKEWVLVFLFEGESSQFEWIRSVLNSGRFDEYFSVLETSRAPEYLKPLPSSSAIAPTEKSWQPLQWLENGVSELANVFGNWEPIAPCTGVTRLSDNAETTTEFKKRLNIAGDPYELRLSCKDHNHNIWRFELRRAEPLAQIPIGIQLRLISQDGNGSEEKEVQAEELTEYLQITLQLESGEGLIWQIDPEPENYQPEVLWF
jgi:hypothetical protein